MSADWSLTSIKWQSLPEIPTSTSVGIEDQWIAMPVVAHQMSNISHENFVKFSIDIKVLLVLHIYLSVYVIII